MFTGIVQSVGRVESLTRSGAGARIEIGAAASLLRQLKRGGSIAVNGCCLTVVGKRANGFLADLSLETLTRTALGGYRRGDRVNLETPLRAGDPLGGHMLQGHVEAVGQWLELKPVGKDGGWWLAIEAPEEVRQYLIPKGSLAVDGISLTIASLEGGRVGFAIIPHTYRHTHLAHLRPGAAVNLETDPIARHLERLLEARRAAKPDLSVRDLRRQGF